MSESTISYNGFTFPFTRLQVEENQRFADDQITNIGTEYEFSVTGWITAEDHPTMQSLLYEMRCKLRERGKALSVLWKPDGGVDSTFWDFDPTPGSQSTACDDYGPFPGSLQISQISGGLAAAYSWSVRAYRKECFDGNCDPFNPINDVLSVTRSYLHTIDKNGMTTRTCRGILRLRANGVNADRFRGQCTPPIPTSFQRVTQNFDVSPNGLELSFTFVDQEVMFNLPANITSGDVDYSVRFNGGLNASALLADLTLSGYLEAPPTTQKSVILQRIAALAAAYFNVNQPGLVFESRELRSSIFGNRIDFSITATAPYATSGATNFDLGLNELLMSPPNTPTNAVQIGPYGASTNALVAANPVTNYDACTSASVTQPTGQQQGTSLAPGSQNGPDRSPNQPGNAPSQVDVSPAHTAAPWLAYHENISYELDNGIKIFRPKIPNAVPIAQQASIPTMTIIQAGYAVKFGKQLEHRPTAPIPFVRTGGIDRGVVLNSFVHAGQPEPVGDGAWNKYTIHWRYVMTYTNSAFTEQGSLSNMQPKFPADPRRSSTTENGGELILPALMLEAAT